MTAVLIPMFDSHLNEVGTATVDLSGDCPWVLVQVPVVEDEQ